jgi:anaerobic magnesium-protoporphyrin IX monomethyl ester cyclase
MSRPSSHPDVLLVQPPFGGPYNFWKSESLGMGYLASSLESRGYSVEVLDGFLLDLDVKDVVQHVLDAPPNLLLGLSMLSYELYRTGDDIIRRLRQAGYGGHVTVGSWFPTFWYRTMLDEGLPVDSVVLAEGERSICALADYLHTGRWGDAELFLSREQIGDVVVLRQNATLLDVDSLPHPRRDYLPEVFQRYHLATSYTARGCGYNRCTFCSVPKFYSGGPKHRLRSAANVVEEVEAISRQGANFLFFSDEDFLGEAPAGPERALRIFEGVAERGVSMRYTFNCTTMGVEEDLFRRLVDLGLAAVYIGMESNLDRTLKLFVKGVRRPQIDRAVAVLRDLDVKLVPGWIMFERDTTLEEVEAQLEFLSTLGAYHVNYLKSLYVMKDTPMERVYGDDLYRTYYHTRYFFQYPAVDLLVVRPRSPAHDFGSLSLSCGESLDLECAPM